VYAVLGDKMREQIHALSMNTLTPGEWAQSQAISGVARTPSSH
jgi:acid stress-induced BolA-like protein IbaG/YrbA